MNDVATLGRRLDIASQRAQQIANFGVIDGHIFGASLVGNIEHGSTRLALWIPVWTLSSALADAQLMSRHLAFVPCADMYGEGYS